MSTGLYGITTRASGTVLTASIYNADHLVHVTNQTPQMTGGYSDSTGQMQTQTSPGALASESLATSLAGELERLRFVIARLANKNMWYDIPGVLDHGQCRLNFISTTQIRLDPLNGNRLLLPSVGYVQVPSAGIALANTGFTAGTFQYIYAFSNSGTPTLEASATAPVTDTNTGVKIKGGPDQTRALVGAVFMDAGTPGTFADGSAKRWTASWFNRRKRSLLGSSGQTTGFSTNNTQLEVASARRVQFIGWADSDVNIRVAGRANSGAASGVDAFIYASIDGGTLGGINGGRLFANVDGTLGMSETVGNVSEGANHYGTVIGQTSTLDSIAFTVQVSGDLQI